LAAEIETTSDYEVIEMWIFAAETQVILRRKAREYTQSYTQKWLLSVMDSDRLVAAVLAGAWPMVGAGQAAPCPDNRADRLVEVLTRTCDVAMPKAHTRPGYHLLVDGGDRPETRSNACP